MASFKTKPSFAGLISIDTFLKIISKDHIYFNYIDREFKTLEVPAI